MPRNLERDAEALWEVTYFYLDRYLKYEVQAPSEHFATMFARKSMEEDGYARSHLSFIKCERVG